MFQRLSVALQRGNAVSFLSTFTDTAVVSFVNFLAPTGFVLVGQNNNNNNNNNNNTSNDRIFAASLCPRCRSATELCYINAAKILTYCYGISHLLAFIDAGPNYELRTPATNITNGHHQRTSSQQFYNLCCTTKSPPTDKNLPHPSILTCRDVGLWHCDVANLLQNCCELVRWWCPLVVLYNMSVAGVRVVEYHALRVRLNGSAFSGNSMDCVNRRSIQRTVALLVFMTRPPTRSSRTC